MTNLEALLAEVEPYTPGSLTLEKALIDVGLDMQENYKDEKLIALAALKALAKMMVLGSESESKFSQAYNDKLEQRILLICNKYGFEANGYIVQSSLCNGSNHW
ncbi:MAG: DUF6706 family protein [Solitalea-like symbiont of Acarus siro]